mmetsp:Transcript_10502/g.28580  ORF Transcript_10502/g.28580 Transcript_10502/m.28580 type:complete len:206 (+) Transcript_10502:555-1172(+)
MEMATSRGSRNTASHFAPCAAPSSVDFAAASTSASVMFGAMVKSRLLKCPTLGTLCLSLTSYLSSPDVLCALTAVAVVLCPMVLSSVSSLTSWQPASLAQPSVMRSFAMYSSHVVPDFGSPFRKTVMFLLLAGIFRVNGQMSESSLTAPSAPSTTLPSTTLANLRESTAPSFRISGPPSALSGSAPVGASPRAPVAYSERATAAA